MHVFQGILCNFFTFEIDAVGKYLSPKMSTVCFPFNHAIYVSIQIDLGQYFIVDPF